MRHPPVNMMSKQSAVYKMKLCISLYLIVGFVVVNDEGGPGS